MISDKYGLVHPEEEVRRVVARLSHRDPLRGKPCWPRPATPAALVPRRVAVQGAGGPGATVQVCAGQVCGALVTLHAELPPIREGLAGTLSRLPGSR